MLGMGAQEIAIIALFALIIFGPGKMPEMMKEAGKHYRKFKGMADQMTGELNKATADARKELDGALGDLGPMGQDLEKSLGMKGKTNSRTTSTGSKSTSSAAKKSTSKTPSKRTSSTSSSRSSSSTSTSKSSIPSATKTSTKPVVATKEDPLADFSLFEGVKPQRERRTRVAAPSAITDLTPRDIFGDIEPEVAEKTPITDLASSENPVARARARRRTAGYARA